MITRVAAVVALIVAFAVGAATGYAANTLVNPTHASSRVTACAPGAHPVVWYSAQTWSCVRDQ